MGLDQYAFYARKEDAGDNAAMGKALNENEFQYWRKEYCIDAWMMNLYQKKGGKDEFNCEPVQVEESDLYDLEEALKTEDFYDNERFFFDEPDDDAKDYIKKRAEKFIIKARSYIEVGYDVYYYNWW
jgi:hypothetical protein